jgi:predicted nucleic acid-binding protein
MPAGDPASPVVVDTAVWVSAALPAEPTHDHSVRLLAALARGDRPLLVPELGRVEFACAMARRTTEAIARDALAWQARHPAARPVPLDDAVLRLALDAGVRLRLRTLDAVMLAVAVAADAQLVTWDRELLDRAAAITPTAWLEADARGSD